MTSTMFCTLGQHEVAASGLRPPPPSAPNRRQCRSCVNARKRSAYIKAKPFDWAARFLNRVVASDGCWSWLGAHANGYGVTTILGDLWLVHRVSYFLHTGDLPEGAYICHHCDNPGCCNPAHLYAGDVRTNAADASARDRFNPRIGEQSGQAVLNTEQVQDIRDRYARGAGSHAQLATQYGVSSSTIGNVVNRRHWRHVT